METNEVRIQELNALSIMELIEKYSTAKALDYHNYAMNIESNSKEKK